MFRVAPPVAPAFVAIPTEPKVPKIPVVLVTPVTFIEVNAKTLGADIEFEAHRFPPIWRVAPALTGTVPTPTTPRGPKILAVLAVRTFIEISAKMFGADMEFDA